MAGIGLGLSAIFIYLFFIVIAFVIAYFLIKSAVRNGTYEALEEFFPPLPPSPTTQLNKQGSVPYTSNGSETEFTSYEEAERAAMSDDSQPIDFT